MRTFEKLCFVISVLCPFLISCSSSSPGSHNNSQGVQPSGKYEMTAWQCGSTNIYNFLTDFSTGGSIVSLGLTAGGAQSSSTVTYADECLLTQPLTISYSGTSMIETPGTNNCSASCTNQCSGPASPVSTFTPSLDIDGQTIVFSRTLASSDISSNQVLQAAGCTAGEEEAQFWKPVTELPSTNNGTFSCNSSAQSLCYDFTGSYFTSTTATQACTAFGGSYTFSSSSACSSTSRVGSCTIVDQANEVIITRYYSGLSSTDQSECIGDGGVYTAN